MLAAGIVVVIGLVGRVLGAEGATEESRAVEAAGSGRVYGAMQRGARRIARMIEHVHKEGVRESFEAKSAADGVSAEARQMYSELMDAYGRLQDRMSEFGDAVGDEACPLAERKRLAKEVVNSSTEVMRLSILLDVECGFGEETLEYVEDVCREYCGNLIYGLYSARYERGVSKVNSVRYY